MIKPFKRFFLLVCFICAVMCILCVGFYPHLSFLLYIAFMLQTCALFVYTYDILKIKKQATIKAYYKLDSIFHRYFGRFFVAKILSFGVALIGSVSLFFMLLFPSGSDILIFCLLVPCSVYGFKIVHMICSANISIEFATTLAKKYTALIAAVLAVVFELMLNGIAPLESSAPQGDVYAHYHALIQSYNIAQMHSHFWQELFGFVLLKKSFLDVLYLNVADSYLRFGLIMLFACGHFASFASFALLCVGGISPNGAQDTIVQDSKNTHDNFTSQALDTKILASNTPTIPQDTLDSKFSSTQCAKVQDFTQTRAFRQFFAMVFFLIFVYIAFNISIHLQPLAKSKNLPPLISSQILKDNEQYIQISLQGTHNLLSTSDLPSLERKIKENLADFESGINADTEQILNAYLAQKEKIIDEYSSWYFSVRGEYTRLFYAAIGKGEDIAQEQFIFLLKTYTPYDLQERLNALYDTHFSALKTRLEQTFGFFTLHRNPTNAHITQAISFDEFSKGLELLNPRASDGVAALLSASIVGAMILKASGKAVAKTGAKVIGKSVAKKSLSGAIGAGGGSLLCGGFAPLCAIGFFVASDYAINSVDEIINEEDFKDKMRQGFASWESQLKTSLIDYNSQLSYQILENLGIAEISKSQDSKNDVDSKAHDMGV